jgi:hypothetical protein
MTTLRKQTRRSARRANKRLAPVASDAFDMATANAARYAETTRDWAGPKVEAARDWAGPRVEPAVAKVKEDVLPKVAGAVAAALAASEPAREEARSRGTAAVAALRGQLEPPKPKKHRLRKLFLLAGVVGAAVAGWKAWVGSTRNEPEPWASPVGTSDWTSGSSASTTPAPAATEAAAGAATAAGLSATGAGGAPTTDDAAGASPDEALADATDQSTAGTKAGDAKAGGSGATSGARKTTEAVTAKQAQMVADEAGGGSGAAPGKAGGGTRTTPGEAGGSGDAKRT